MSRDESPRRVDHCAIANRRTILNDCIIQNNAASSQLGVWGDICTRTNQIREAVSDTLRHVTNVFTHCVIANGNKLLIFCKQCLQIRSPSDYGGVVDYCVDFGAVIHKCAVIRLSIQLRYHASKAARPSP